MSAPHRAESAVVELTEDEIDSLVYEAGPDADHDRIVFTVERIIAARFKAERERLVKAAQGFDPSDNYHADEYREPGYYSGVNRVIQLIEGDISAWTDLRIRPGAQGVSS